MSVLLSPDGIPQNPWSIVSFIVKMSDNFWFVQNVIRLLYNKRNLKDQICLAKLFDILISQIFRVSAFLSFFGHIFSTEAFCYFTQLFLHHLFLYNSEIVNNYFLNLVKFSSLPYWPNIIICSKINYSSQIVSSAIEFW